MFWGSHDTHIFRNNGWRASIYIGYQDQKCLVVFQRPSMEQPFSVRQNGECQNFGHFIGQNYVFCFTFEKWLWFSRSYLPGHICLENPVLFWGILGYVQETIEPLALSTYSYVLLIWYTCTYVCTYLFTGLDGKWTQYKELCNIDKHAIHILSILRYYYYLLLHVLRTFKLSREQRQQLSTH